MAHCKQEMIAGFAVYGTTEKRSWFVNRAEEGKVVHGRKQVLTTVNHLSETLEPSALSEIVRAHSKNSKYGTLCLLWTSHCFQDFNENSCLLPSRFFLSTLLLHIAENFFKLVDQNAEIGPPRAASTRSISLSAAVPRVRRSYQPAAASPTGATGSGPSASARA